MLFGEKLSHEDLIKKAKINLQLEQPFFSYILFYSKFIAKEVPTVGITEKLRVFYNPEWVEEHEDYIKTILMHEVMHIVLKHHPRFKEFAKKEAKDKNLANVAMDAVINFQICQLSHEGHSYRFPSDISIHNGCFDFNNKTLIKIGEEYLQQPIHMEGKTWEDVYSELKKQGHEQEQGLMDGDILLDDSDGDKDKKPSDKDMTPEKVSEIVSEAVNHAKLQGKLPTEIERLVDEVYNTKTPWQKILKQNMQGFIPFDFNYRKPSRRSYSLGTYLPMSDKQPQLKLYVGVDTSGSIGEDEMQYFLSEIYSIVKQFMFVEMKVLFCDAKVHEVQSVKTREDIYKLTPKGGGGTSFVPVFDYIQKEHPGRDDILLYLTDGYGQFPKNKPPYNVVWLSISSKREVDYPFGQVVEADIPKEMKI